MRVLKVRNVHEALPTAMNLLFKEGIRGKSRNGDVIRHPDAVATVYTAPTERVEFHPWRDSNPFFHFYESLWMLAGRNDVAPVARYVERMRGFSDDGDTFNAAYGARWRKAWLGIGLPAVDQLKTIGDALRANPDDRQQVLQIWDHRRDLGTVTKDHACNISATMQVFDGHLDVAMFCRSNDVIWGAYGANAVHMSMMHEYVARRAGCSVGRYTQISVNWHAYVDVYERMLEVATTFDAPLTENPYCTGRFLDATTPVIPYPIAEPGVDLDKWDSDCRSFVTTDGLLPRYLPQDQYLPFFRDVAFPIVQAHDLHKVGATGEAISALQECQATDWRLACTNWLRRRQNRRLVNTDKEKL